MRCLGQENAGGVAERRSDARKGLPHRRESLDLAPVDRVLGLLGADEMAHQEIGLERVEALVAGEGQALGDRKTEPVHPRIDVERRREPQSLGTAEPGPFRDLVL